MPPNSTKERKRDLNVEYWFNAGCIAVAFEADHGNEAFCIALGVIKSESDGQPRPVKVTHLLTKKVCEILLNTIQPDIQQRIVQLQGAAAIVIQNKNEFRLTLVPCKAVVGSFTKIFNHIIMDDPCDDGTVSSQMGTGLTRPTYIVRILPYHLAQD
eukprot:1798799-Ditylum_brightwellii.AAC.1